MSSTNFTLDEALQRIIALENRPVGINLVSVYNNSSGTTDSINVSSYINKGYNMFLVRCVLTSTSDYVDQNVILVNDSVANLADFNHHYEYKNVSGGAMVKLSGGVISGTLHGTGSKSFKIYRVFAMGGGCLTRLSNFFKWLVMCYGIC